MWDHFRPWIAEVISSISKQDILQTIVAAIIITMIKFNWFHVEVEHYNFTTNLPTLLIEMRFRIQNPRQFYSQPSSKIALVVTHRILVKWFWRIIVENQNVYVRHKIAYFCTVCTFCTILHGFARLCIVFIVLHRFGRF